MLLGYAVRIRLVDPNVTRPSALVYVGQVESVVIADANRERIADDPLDKAAVDANGDIRMRVSLGQLHGQILKLDVVLGPGVQH
jgi:hypothetical protein